MEIQQVVNEVLLQHVIRYCLNIYNRYGNKPLVVIFAVTGVQPKGAQGTFQPTNKLYIHSTSCTLWATECLLLAPHTSVSIVDKIESSLDSLLAISLFFTQRQACLATHSHNNNPNIQFLYATAKSTMMDITTYNNNLQETLSDICSTNTIFLERVQKEVQKLPVSTNKVNKHTVTAMEYNNRVKRQLSDSASSDDSSMVAPPRKKLVIKKDVNVEAELSFVANFRNPCEDRMDRKQSMKKEKSLDCSNRFAMVKVCALSILVIHIDAQMTFDLPSSLILSHTSLLQ